MSKVVITLRDDGELVAVDFNFEGGFDVNSNAHQHAFILKEWMDDNMQSMDAPAAVEPVPA